jgi:hypothetical protein
LIVTQNAAGGQGFTPYGSLIVAVTDLSINSTPNSITVLAFLSDGTRTVRHQAQWRQRHDGQ